MVSHTDMLESSHSCWSSDRFFSLACLPLKNRMSAWSRVFFDYSCLSSFSFFFPLFFILSQNQQDHVSLFWPILHLTDVLPFLSHWITFSFCSLAVQFQFISIFKFSPFLFFPFQMSCPFSIPNHVSLVLFWLVTPWDWIIEKFWKKSNTTWDSFGDLISPHFVSFFSENGDFRTAPAVVFSFFPVFPFSAELGVFESRPGDMCKM